MLHVHLRMCCWGSQNTHTHTFLDPSYTFLSAELGSWLNIYFSIGQKRQHCVDEVTRVWRGYSFGKRGQKTSFRLLLNLHNQIPANFQPKAQDIGISERGKNLNKESVVSKWKKTQLPWNILAQNTWWTDRMFFHSLGILTAWCQSKPSFWRLSNNTETRHIITEEQRERQEM